MAADYVPAVRPHTWHRVERLLEIALDNGRGSLYRTDCGQHVRTPTIVQEIPASGRVCQTCLRVGRHKDTERARVLLAIGAGAAR